MFSVASLRFRWRPRRALRQLLGLCALTLGATFGAASQTAPQSIIVKPGESLSQIAARYTGDVRQWHQLYDARKSGLPNPHLLVAGQALELVTEESGKRYLRAVGGVAMKAAVAPAAPATPATPVTPPTPPAPATQAALAAPAPAAALAGELVIGVLPNIAAAALVAQYEPLKRYLERTGGGTVRIVVPGNFKAFFEAAVAGEYDVAIAAPHLARVAQLDRALVPLGMYEPRIGALLITPAHGGIASLRDIAGQAVGFANPQSLVAMYGQQWLRGQNLEPGRDYEAKAARTDLGVGRMLLTGEAVAAIISGGEFRALPAEEGARLRIVETFARIPNFIWMAHARLDRGRAERLRAQMNSFFADADDGAAFAKATGLVGFVEATDTTLRELDPYAAATRRAMGLPAR